jgi:N-acetylmuramic acid 6-phosphate etherase
MQILERLNDEDQRVAVAVRNALPQLAHAVELAVRCWHDGGRIILFGAGTSGRLATLDAAELGPTFGVSHDRYQARIAGGPSALHGSVEGAEDDAVSGASAAADLQSNDLAIGITASGRTPWVLGTLAEARRRGAATVGIACVPAPTLAQVADVVVVVDTGAEAIGGSTRLKAGTAQKLLLNAFSTTLMVRLGKVFGNLMVDLQATNAKLRRRAVRLVEQVIGLDTIAAEQVLIEADWDVKVAITAVRLGVEMAEARTRLRSADGVLRRALDDA